MRCLMNLLSKMGNCKTSNAMTSQTNDRSKQTDEAKRCPWYTTVNRNVRMVKSAIMSEAMFEAMIPEW